MSRLPEKLSKTPFSESIPRFVLQIPHTVGAKEDTVARAERKGNPLIPDIGERAQEIPRGCDGPDASLGTRHNERSRHARVGELTLAAACPES